jgi:ABC-2 type transport system ATP-binding protein
VKDLLRRYVSEGNRGVLFSTHTMEVAQEMCHRVGILDGGILQGEGTVPELRSRVARGDASLEEIFLRLTREDEGLPDAAALLGER